MRKKLQKPQKCVDLLYLSRTNDFRTSERISPSYLEIIIRNKSEKSNVLQCVDKSNVLQFFPIRDFRLSHFDFRGFELLTLIHNDVDVCLSSARILLGLC